MVKILLTSKSPIKRKIVQKYFNNFNNEKTNVELNCFDYTDRGLPPQPINNSIQLCAKQRLEFALNDPKVNYKDYDYFISIENGVDTETRADICYVVVKFIKNNTELIGMGYNTISVGDWIDHSILNTAFDKLNFYPIVTHQTENYGEIVGYPITVGEILQKMDKKINPKNWMSTLTLRDRESQIMMALCCAVHDLE